MKGLKYKPLTGIHDVSSFYWYSVQSVLLCLDNDLGAGAPPIPLPLDGGQSRATVDLLTSAEFEINTDGDKIPDGWSGKKTGSLKADKQKCNKNGKGYAHSGNCAFMFKGNPDRSKSKVALEIPANPASGYMLVTIPSGVTITKASVDFRYSGTTGKFFIDDASLMVTTADVPTLTTILTDTATVSPTDNSTHSPTNTSTEVSPTSTATVGTTEGPSATATPILTPLPPFQLIASDGGLGDRFGVSISLNADGSVAIVGVDGKNEGRGAAYVFVQDGNTWM